MTSKLKDPINREDRTRINPVLVRYDLPDLRRRGRNPLIEALPPIRSDNHLLEQLLRLPESPPSDLDRPAYERAYDVVQLKDLFLPNVAHLTFARRLDLLLRWGYRGRNPLSPSHNETAQSLYERALDEPQERIVFDVHAPICGTSLIGVSGGGKSTTTELILTSYPQYVLHPELNLHQVVYLFVQTPKDGSVRELVVNILKAFDVVLGTQHEAEITTGTTALQAQRKVESLCHTHCVGLLVLDELQNLSVKKSGGREDMLNFFQQLVNQLRLPVVLLGTPKAKSVLQLDMRHARRTSLTGSAEWKRLEYGADFNSLLDALWPYQWLQHPGELNEDMRRTFYAETQGIRAFIVDMFLIAQLHVLRLGKEAITPTLFEKVARTEFAPVQPMLRLLREGKYRSLQQYEDLGDYDINDIIDRGMANMPMTAPTPTPQEGSGASFVSVAAAHMCAIFGLDVAAARALVLEAIEPVHRSARAVTAAAVQLYLQRSQGIAAT